MQTPFRKIMYLDITLIWFGHVQRRDSENSMVKGEIREDRRPRGKPKEEIYGCGERGHNVMFIK